MTPLKGKNIVLGITGGIAAYKAAYLVRLLVKSGANVQVIMTPAAREFITPLTLATLSQRDVITEFFTANTGHWNSHVSLGLWADAFVVAPGTASTLAKMATGVADNMLVTSYLSARAKVFIAPAMDFDMMQHPSTQRNIATLRSYGNTIIEPGEGFLASGLEGRGRMAEPEEIVRVLEAHFDTQTASLKGKKILITTGPTFERIDPVRYIGNFSSGKMGIALAREAQKQDARVTLVCGPVAVELPTQSDNMKVLRVESACEMLEACKGVFQDIDIAIMAAAVADYRPENPSEFKIKREGNRPPEIHLVQNPDIASYLGHAKKSHQKVVGFALETDNALDNARKKIKAKNLDAIILNSLADAGAGFGTDTNKVTILGPEGVVVAESPLMPKVGIAKFILMKLSDVLGL